MRYYLSDLHRAGVLFFPSKDDQPCPKVKFSNNICISMSVITTGHLVIGDKEIPVSVFLSSTAPSYVTHVCSDENGTAKAYRKYLRSVYFERFFAPNSALRAAVNSRIYWKLWRLIYLGGTGTVFLFSVIVSLMRPDVIPLSIILFLLHIGMIKYSNGLNNSVYISLD